MTKEDLLSHVGSCRSKTQRTINDTCIWCSVALDSIEQSLRDKSVLTRDRFSVPSAKPKKTVAREPEAVEAIVREAIDGHLYSSLLVYLVAQLEASLGEVMREVLVFDPRRLKCKVQGISHNNTVDVASVIGSQSRDELLQTIVDSELISVSYANPKAQLTYMEKVLGITLDGTIKAEWREIKATRDIIVHSSGVVNAVYLTKAESLARGRIGDTLDVDRPYFEASASTMKSLIGRVCSQFQRKMRSGGPTRAST